MSLRYMGKIEGKIEENIKKLREANQGYKRIAHTLGLSRDIVRNISKHLKLAGYRGGFQVKKPQPLKPTRYCAFCGKTIEERIHPGLASKYCSEKCRREQDKAEKRRGRMSRLFHEK